MKTITLHVDERVFDKFQWLLSHFKNDEIRLVGEADRKNLSEDEVDEHISAQELSALKEVSARYKSGDTSEFEEYIL